jgi:hypothetical protein
MNPNSAFFANSNPNLSKSNKTPLLLNNSKNQNNLKNKNLEYMINIRRNNRKDIIRNNRFKNVMKVTGQSTNTEDMIVSSNGIIMSSGSKTKSGFPVHLSHLEKVKDAQRILKILYDVETITPNNENLKQYIESIRNGSRFEKHQGIIYLRKLLSSQKGLPIQETLDLNAVPMLIELAKDTSELHLRLEATWCLANLVSGSTQQTQFLVGKDIIELFEEILEDKNNQIVEQAIWGLGNIIGDSSEFRKKIVKKKIMNKLIIMFSKKRGLKIQKNIIWCLSNILRNKPKKEKHIEMKNLVITLVSAFIVYDDLEIKKDCVQGLKDYCKPDLLSLFTKDEFMLELRKFYKLLYNHLHNNDYNNIKSEISAIHKIIGNITNGDDFDTAKVIDEGFLSDLCILLNVDNELCKREICWILSNIAAGTSGQIGSILNEPNLFDNLVNLLYTSTKQIRRESLWIICNMTKNCSKEQLDYLINKNILKVFQEFLAFDQDSKLMILILEAIPYMIKRSVDGTKLEPKESPFIDVLYDSGIAELISELQRHESEFIYEQTQSILELYFDLEEY